MITKYRVQNFKAWRDTGRIRCAPITVFFGVNSSGKTSLHQLLLMLKQTAQSPDRKRVLHPGDANTIIDLGTVQDLVFAHDSTESIAFEIEWEPYEPLLIVDPRTEHQYSGSHLQFDAEIAQREAKDGALYVKRLHYLVKGDATEISVTMQPGGTYQRYDLKVEGYELIRQPGRAWQLPRPIRFYGFPDEVKAYYQNGDFLADLALKLEQLLGQLYYVGPLREYPRRSYAWSGETPDHVGVRGERAVEALLAARTRRLNRAYKTRGEPFEVVVARWLEQMGLIQQFETRQIAANRKEYEVVVWTAGSQHKVNLTDVGFGVSQVLPVLVECFYVPAASTIVFEQPEIHLHPRVQGALADLFVEAVHTREGGRDRRIQLIVESHSEHFLRRLQRRIAEGLLQPQEAALYFCRPGIGGSTIQELELDELGNIKNWPEGFFGDELGDLTAMAEAAAARQA